MRTHLSLPIVLLSLAFLATPSAQAQAPVSGVHVTHSRIVSGELQTVTVSALDLAGHALARAAVSATVTYSGARPVRYSAAKTNTKGLSVISFHVPTVKKQLRAWVRVTVSNGFLSIPLSGSFLVLPASSVPKPVGTPTVTPTPTTPTASPSLVLVARAIPPDVQAPNPAWLVVYVHTPSGTDSGNAPVDAEILFREGSLHLAAMTDDHGVATIRVDTTAIRANETVEVGLVARWKGMVGTGATELVVQSAPLAPTATPTPTPLPPTPTPTLAPLAPVPTPTNSPVPTATATPTIVPTATPTATATPSPTATNTPTATATATRIPTPVPACPGTLDGCRQAVVNMINQARAQYGVTGVVLNSRQSSGAGQCVGSQGHSQAMADSGSIWHYNSSYPAASFPNDICVSGSTAAENVGQCSQGNELEDLQCIHDLMMSEPYSPGCSGSHICNILSSDFGGVGIGIVQAGGSTYLTEDFVGGGT